MLQAYAKARGEYVMAKKINLETEQESAVLVGLVLRGQTEEKSLEHLVELAFLSETAGVVVKYQFVQKLSLPDQRYFVGTGKLEEIAAYIKAEKIDVAIFDDELSGSQIRNLEKALKCKILDRTNLILDIFAQRARTAHAKVQVELAQYQYLLPRLTRMWTHLERQRGGIGMRGPGETEIETDRRIIRDRIALLKKRLESIDKQMHTQRQNRGSLVRVALVGYTNAGKSTLMNLLSKSEVFAENKLFATLDTTVRKVVIENLPFLLSDTVGFIRKLPHALVESFKSTLDEVREADILLHMVDISHPEFEDHIRVVNTTLQEIGAAEQPMIMLFNKIDNYTYEAKEEDDLSPMTIKNYSLEDWKKTWMSKDNAPAIFISAKDRTNVQALKDKLYHEVKKIHAVRYPYQNYLY